MGGPLIASDCHCACHEDLPLIALARPLPPIASLIRYEDRDVNLTSRGCYCSPIPNESRKKQLRGDWRTEMLHKKLREPRYRNGALLLCMQVLTTTPHPLPHRYRDGALLLVPMHNLTFDQWDMHIARTRPEHARPLPNTSVDERLAAVCDCTHFCHKPQFWSGAFFPALRAALLKGEQREAEQLRGRTAAPALWR